MSKLSKSFIAVVFLVSGSFIFINAVKAQEISDLLNLLQIPGRIEGTGIHFEITDSEYLNLILESSEETKLRIESIPEMITMMIEPISSTVSTQITISGLASSTTYYKYQDDYHNLTEFTTDENGGYTYIQDLSKSHFIFIQPRASTKFIKDDATGGDCYLIGTWDTVAKTCTLTTDFNETIQIDSDGVTLDGNGRIIIGTGTGSGIFLSGRNNITIKNLDISKFTYGVFLWASNNNSITNNFSHNNYNDGIRIDDSWSNNIKDNTISYNYFGIAIWGFLNNIINNNIISNGSRGIWIGGEISPAFNLISSNIISNSSFGIQMTGANSDTISNNTFSNYSMAVYSEAGARNNKVFNNNFMGGWIDVYLQPGNIYNLPLPIGGNYWSKFAASCIDINNDNICDSPYFFLNGQDNFPWKIQNGWSINHPPVFSNPNQYKSDGITLISENATTTENIVIFKAILNDPDNDQAKLQVELKEFNQPFNEQDLLESEFVSPGSEDVVSRQSLVDGSYKWRARAMDDKSATSEWQEFGTSGNIDFEVKLVPLYTQVYSPYPSYALTDEWSVLPYADGRGNLGPVKERCGLNIAQCGCAITSMVMLGRYYNIDTGIDNSSVDPLNINSWLTDNNGYTEYGKLYWGKAIEYLGYIDKTTSKKMVRFDFNPETDYNVTSISPQINDFLNSAKPIVAYSKVFGHYFVIDGKLTSTNTLKDPKWYNTRKLNQPQNLTEYIQGYGNHFDTANLFTYLEQPKPIAASMHIYLASPAELLITDPLGRKLGKDPVTGIIYDEIPDSIYTKESPIISSDTPLNPEDIHESKVVYISSPIDGEYDIKVIGIEAGIYTLGILAYDQNANSKDITQTGNIITNAIQEFDLNYSLETVQQTQLSRIVDIDIKPRSDPNSINCQNLKDIIPVAILTTPIFDAITVDADTVRFGLNTAQEIHKDKNGKAKRHLEDVDKDGDLDLVFHFRFGDTGIQCSDTKAVLTGKTLEGFDIIGSDSIRTAPGNNKQGLIEKLFETLSFLRASLYNALTGLLKSL